MPHYAARHENAILEHVTALPALHFASSFGSGVPDLYSFASANAILGLETRAIRFMAFSPTSYQHPHAAQLPTSAGALGGAVDGGRCSRSGSVSVARFLSMIWLQIV